MNEAPRSLRARHRAGVLAAQGTSRMASSSPAVRSAKRLAVSLVCLAGLSLVACSGRASAGPTVVPDIQGVPHCVTVEAAAMTSPHSVVHGAYACLDATARAEANNEHITSDAGFEAYAAQPPVFTHYTYVSLTQGWYSFRLSGAGGAQCFGVQANSAGLADRLAFAATSTGLCGV